MWSSVSGPVRRCLSRSVLSWSGILGVLLLGCAKHPASAPDPKLVDLGARLWAVSGSDHVAVLEVVPAGRALETERISARKSLNRRCPPPLSACADDAPLTELAHLEALGSRARWTATYTFGPDQLSMGVSYSCTASDLGSPDLPRELVCGKNGRLTIEPDGDGFETNLMGPNWDQLDGDGQQLTRARPMDVAFRMVSRPRGNSSPETDWIGSVIESKSTPEPPLRDLEQAIASQGVDPATIPLADAIEMRDELAGDPYDFLRTPAERLHDLERIVRPILRLPGEPKPPEKVLTAEATTTPSGLAYEMIDHGYGSVHPTDADGISVSYRAWRDDGVQIVGVQRVEVATVVKDMVIPGFWEAMTLLVEGDKATIWVPEELAYEGDPDRPGGTLMFEVYVLTVVPELAPPLHVAEPPDDALQTPRGVFWIRTSETTGGVAPEPTDRIHLRAPAWTTDGVLVSGASTVGAADPRRVSSLIPGLSEAIQLLAVGERATFWVPATGMNTYLRKRYQMLVFDIELLEIVSPPEP
jgi:FKBP-type peptidyl-prolyl cis-trans isomerase